VGKALWQRRARIAVVDPDARRQLEIAGREAPSRILHRVVERNVGHLLIFLIDPQVPFLVMLSFMASGVTRTLAIPSTKISLAK